MRRRAAAVAVLGLALAGCGSTVQVSGRAMVGADAQLGTTGGAPNGQAQAPGATSPTGPGGLTGQGPSAPLTAASSGPAVSGPTVAGAVPGAVGGTKPVEVGIVLFPDVNQFAAALGSSANTGDQQAIAQTAVDWVNKNGGFAGHNVVPVFFNVQLTSTQPYSVTYQQICDSFTKDHHVVATILIANVDNAMPQCLASGGSMSIINGHEVHAADDYTAVPSMVTPSEAGGDRVARALAHEILSRQLVKRGDTLGVLVMDYHGPNEANDKILTPAMKAAGVDVLTYKIHAPQSTPDIASSVQQVQSAQLQMRARGVKAVTFICPGCATFFVQYAESQGYYPDYVFTSLDSLKKTFGGQGHGKSAANGFAVGWDPIRDVGTYADPSLLRSNSTYRLCLAIEKGQYTNDDSVMASEAFCGALLDLRAAATANPTAVTGRGLVQGFLGLGSSHPSSFNISTLLGRGHVDGPSSYQTLHYVSSCDCFRYDAGRTKPLA